MKSKRIIAGIISIITAVSLPVTTGAVGKILSSDMTLTALQKFADKNTYSYRIFEYEKENAQINADSKEYELEYHKQLLRNISRGDSQYAEYMLKADELEKETAIAEMEQGYYEEGREEADKKLNDLVLKSKYYELCGLENQAEVQRANVQYMKKYAEIESVKLERGNSTETDCRLARVNLKMAENDLLSAENAVHIKTREVSDFMNQYSDNEKFSIDCVLPQKLVYRKFDAEKLYKKFSENNFELKKNRKSMEYDRDQLETVESLFGKESDTYIFYNNLYEIDTLNSEVLENSYKSQITALVSGYRQAYEKYEISSEYIAVLNEKLEILYTAYDSGNVSELEYLKQCAELRSEICLAENAAADADLLCEKLCLAEEGIWYE